MGRKDLTILSAFTRHSDERMANRYNSSRKMLVFSVGHVVSLRIPRIDRTSSDQPRLPCVVVEVKGKAQSLYRLRYLSTFVYQHS